VLTSPGPSGYSKPPAHLRNHCDIPIDPALLVMSAFSPPPTPPAPGVPNPSQFIQSSQPVYLAQQPIQTHVPVGYQQQLYQHQHQQILPPPHGGALPKFVSPVQSSPHGSFSPPSTSPSHMALNSAFHHQQQQQQQQQQPQQFSTHPGWTSSAASSQQPPRGDMLRRAVLQESTLRHVYQTLPVLPSSPQHFQQSNPGLIPNYPQPVNFSQHNLTTANLSSNGPSGVGSANHDIMRRTDAMILRRLLATRPPSAASAGTNTTSPFLFADPAGSGIYNETVRAYIAQLRHLNGLQ
jgi:hypothetical protein